MMEISLCILLYFDVVSSWIVVTVDSWTLWVIVSRNVC